MALRRFLLPKLALLMAALWVCGAPSAFAVTFSQAGNTVQVNTLNEVTSWTLSLHFSDTTESPIPTTDEKLWNNITVPSGQTAYSFVMPDLHRRYRFDVTSVKPSQQASVTVPGSSWSFGSGASMQPSPRWQLVRGASVVSSGAITPNAVLTVDTACEAGDVLRVTFGGVVIPGSALNVNTAGTLKAGTLRMLEVNAGDEYDDNWVYSWSGAAYVVYGAAAVDDSGTGTFENPDWTGFATSTPEPTSTPDSTSSVIASGTVAVGKLGGLDSNAIDAFLAVLAFTAGAVTWRQVVPHRAR